MHITRKNLPANTWIFIDLSEKRKAKKMGSNEQGFWEEERFSQGLLTEFNGLWKNKLNGKKRSSHPDSMTWKGSDIKKKRRE